MQYHKLMYNNFRKEQPYEFSLRESHQQKQILSKQAYFSQVLSFRQSRYPRELLVILEQNINPYDYSIEKLKQLYANKYPQYSNELVYKCVEFVLNKKCQKSIMIKESAIIIEDGDEQIRNGRQLQKQQFTFDFSRGQIFEKKHKKNEKKSNQQESKRNEDESSQPITTERSNYEPARITQVLNKSKIFNEFLQQEINREKKRFENITIINQGESLDIINNPEGQWDEEEHHDESFPYFNENDLIVQPEVLDTDRTEIEELNYILSNAIIDSHGGETGRSKKSSLALKINKNIMNNLYDSSGHLKLNLVRKAVDKMKKNSQESPQS